MANPEDTKKLVNRLSIIAGQIEGIKKMIQAEKSDCIKVFTQIKAVNNGMKKVGQKLIEGRMKECIAGKKAVDDNEIAELLKAMMD